MKWIDGQSAKKMEIPLKWIIFFKIFFGQELEWVITFGTFQWHFHFFGTLSVYPFHRHLLYPFLWHLVCPSISYWPKLFKKFFNRNTHICVLFSLTTSQSQNWFQKHIWNENVYISIQKLVWEFWSIWNGWTDQVSQKWIEEISISISEARPLSISVALGLSTFK